MAKIQILLSFLLVFNYLPPALAGVSNISITWTKKDFPLEMEIYSVRPEKAAFVTETGHVKDIKDSPADKLLNGKMTVQTNSSEPAVLIVKNPTEKDFYFFAVPHELNPHHASAGHYFECLCNSRVYKVPAKSVWYRIVRVNLNSSFQNLKSFEINHQLIGISEADAKGKYKDRLYEKD
jgi:hypothetical protein